MLSYARTVSLSPEQHRSIEGLVAQVNVDNVLQVARLMREHADAIERQILDSGWQLQVGRCGDDPVSKDAQQLFQAKIDRITAVHWAHCAELREVVNALRTAADQYSFTDMQLEAAFGKVGP